MNAHLKENQQRASVLVTHGNYLVEVMADSYIVVPTEYCAKGYHRLTTLRVIFPRIVLSELNTHRLLSRNSASSRAIPIAKMLELVMENPFIPDRFPRAHKGMQAQEWVYSYMPEYEVWKAKWLAARDRAVAEVKELDALGMSKQLANRILEPFLMHQVIISATEWDNFLALRVHPDAQNEIFILASLILEAMNDSKPTLLKPGEWHLPFGDRLDATRLEQAFDEVSLLYDYIRTKEDAARSIVAARCGRISYNNFEGQDDYVKDIAMCDRLITQGHMSPLEHVARAQWPHEYTTYLHRYPDHDELGWCGNFRGFVQYRKTFDRTVENRSEPRLKTLIP